MRGMLARAAARAGHTILLAEAGSEAVGYAWFEVADRPPTPLTHRAREVRVHQIGVASAWRRRGLGSALLDEVRGAARRAGVGTVVLDHMADHGDAAAFYEARGFRPYRVFRRSFT